MRARSFSFASAVRALLIMAGAAAVLAACQAGAQYPNPGPASQPAGPVPGISATRPRFSTDASVQPGSGGAPEVRLDYRLARAELLFERTPEGYQAAYEVRVSFYGAKKRLVAGNSFTRELRVARYAETSTRGDDIVDHVTFRVPAGKYDIRVDLTDLNAERTSSTEFPFEVPATPAGPIWMTDLTLGTIRADSERQESEGPRVEPNPSRHYRDDLARLAVSAEIVDGRPPQSPDSVYRLHYEIRDDFQSSVARGDTAIARRGGRTPFLLRPALMALDPGSYRVVVELTSPLIPPPKGKKPVPLRREKPFTVEQSASSVALDPRAALEVLRYIATADELREMDRLRTAGEREAFWEAFWKRRDPSPETPVNEAMDEFYKRVQYANQHFGAGVAGWRTDMGRIYIRYGQPDEVVRNPFRFEGPPEEIWYYYRERKTFTFVDRDGFGRYELDEPRSSPP